MLSDLPITFHIMASIKFIFTVIISYSFYFSHEQLINFLSDNLEAGLLLHLIKYEKKYTIY